MPAPLPVPAEYLMPMEGQVRDYKPRIVGPASEIEPAQRYCTCCERPLRGKVAWLELDQRTNTYHDFGGIPSNESQGWFPFGLTCARNKLKEVR